MLNSVEHEISFITSGLFEEFQSFPNLFINLRFTTCKQQESLYEQSIQMQMVVNQLSNIPVYRHSR